MSPYPKKGDLMIYPNQHHFNADLDISFKIYIFIHPSLDMFKWK